MWSNVDRVQSVCPISPAVHATMINVCFIYGSSFYRIDWKHKFGTELTCNGELDRESSGWGLEAVHIVCTTTSVVVDRIGIQRSDLDMMNCAWFVEEVSIGRVFSGGRRIIHSGSSAIFDQRRDMLIIGDPCNSHVICPNRWYMNLNRTKPNQIKLSKFQATQSTYFVPEVEGNEPYLLRMWAGLVGPCSKSPFRRRSAVLGGDRPNGGGGGGGGEDGQS